MRARIRKSVAAALPELQVSAEPATGALQAILTDKGMGAALLFPLGPDLVGWSFDVARNGAPATTIQKAAASFSFHGDRFSIPLQSASASPRVWKNTAIGAVTKDGPLPTGGGVLTLATPTVEHGIHADGLHEYFVTRAGSGLNGIVVLRQKGEDKAWGASVSKTLVPYVLSKEAVAAGTMPPDGKSALPSSLERVVPPEYQYWKAAGADAVRMRNELAGSGFFDARLLKVVDGEIRLCVERLFLYEADASAAVPSATKSLVDALPDGAPIDSPLAGIDAPASWAGAVAKVDREGAILVLSAPVDGQEAALASLAKGLKADWLIDVTDSLVARRELSRIAPVFKLEGAPERLFAASFRLASEDGILRNLAPVVPVSIVKVDGLSFDDLRSLVQEAISEKFPPKEDDDQCCMMGGAWVSDLYDTYAVFGRDGKLWRIGYSFGNGAVTLTGEPEQVVRTYAPVAGAGAKPQPGAAGKADKAVASAVLCKVTLRKDDDKRIVYGVVLEPETTDAQNDVYSADEVERAAHVYMAKFRNSGVMHQKMVNDKVDVVESFIAPVDMLINEQQVKKGSWVMAVHISDDDLWKAVRDGGLTGFSIGGSAVRRPDEA